LALGTACLPFIAIVIVIAIAIATCVYIARETLQALLDTAKVTESRAYEYFTEMMMKLRRSSISLQHDEI